MANDLAFKNAKNFCYLQFQVCRQNGWMFSFGVPEEEPIENVFSDDQTPRDVDLECPSAKAFSKHW